jgi:hypothetical protein
LPFIAARRSVFFLLDLLAIDSRFIDHPVNGNVRSEHFRYRLADIFTKFFFVEVPGLQVADGNNHDVSKRNEARLALKEQAKPCRFDARRYRLD